MSSDRADINFLFANQFKVKYRYDLKLPNAHVKVDVGFITAIRLNKIKKAKASF